MPTPKTNWVEGEFFTPAAANDIGQAIVDLQDGAAQATAVSTNAAASKATPVDADVLPLADSAASFGLKKLSWANLKAAIAAYYNTLTATLTNKTLTNPRINAIYDTNGAPFAVLTGATSAVNYWSIVNGAAGSGVALYASGADANVSMNFYSKGDGTVNLRSNTNGVAFVAQPVTSGVNYAQATSAASGQDVSLSTQGSDANINLDLRSKGTGVVEANGVPVVTTTGTQTLSNKTISGASNSLSSIPQSAVTSLVTDLAGKQGTAQKGVANGYASLDGSGKLPTDQMPSVVSVLSYRGTWNASTNSPTLANGTGTAGHTYRVDTAGTALGSTFAVGDYVIYTGSVWQKSLSTDDATRNAVERTATATLTNKTISGASNTVTNLPASATPDAARIVNTIIGVSNQWAKVASFAPGSNAYFQCSLTLGVSCYGSNSSSIISLHMGNQGSGTAPVATISMLAKGSGNVIVDDGFKIVCDAYGSPVELWVKTQTTGGQIVFWELGRFINFGSLSYTVNPTFQASEPVGLVTNATSSGVSAGGVPVVTTTGTQTLTNKTLTTPTITEPRVETIRDNAGSGYLASANSRVYVSPLGRPALEVLGSASAVNTIGINGGTTGNSPTIYATGSDATTSIALIPKGSGGIQLWSGLTANQPRLVANGPDTNHDLNLQSKGTGVVQANGVPVATTTGAQSLTNKTISGASNTVTNLPASATPDAARLVCTTATGSNGAENGANTWAKLATITVPATAQGMTLLLGVTSSAVTTSTSCILSVTAYTNTGPTAFTDLSIIGAGTCAGIASDSFKLVGNASLNSYELWVRKTSNFAQFNVYELSRIAASASVVYHDAAPWQSATPVGAAVNVSSNGVAAFGVPVVTTTGTQTLTNKSLTSPVVDQLKTSTGGTGLAFNGVASAANAIGVSNSIAGAAPYVYALGSDANVNLNLASKGTGVVQANGNPVGVRVAVPASATATGASGQWAADNSWIYVCIASGTWRRAALSTW
jgi:hypothetical protein